MSHLFRQFVLKVHSRCDLACDHCYVYESVDQSWRDQPTVIAPETLAVVSRSIRHYADSHQLDSVHVVLHGGEPLLLGHRGMRDVITGLKREISPVTDLVLTLQTNGVRLDRTFADLFLEEGVRVGISLDGGKAANDRHRRFRRGASSYPMVVRAVALMASSPYRSAFAGLLCTVDVANDPVGVFEDLQALNPPAIDLLLPHATWEHPPSAARSGTTPYGDWLSQIFDRWFDAPPKVGIRIFEELVNTLLGGVSRSEAVGRSAPESVVIETDGSLEQTDALKVAYPGAAATGLTLFKHSLDDLLHAPGHFSSASQFGELSATCRACPVVDACGGGLYPHRYRPGAGFANPSVYCHDLKRLIDHIADRLHTGLGVATTDDLAAVVARRLASNDASAPVPIPTAVPSDRLDPAVR